MQKNKLNNILMEHSLYLDSMNGSKTFTIRKGVRTYNKYSFIESKKTGRKIPVLITNQKVLKAGNIEKAYFNSLLKFYEDLTIEDDVTIVHYSTTKKCSCCNKIKNINEFYKNHYKCKKCDYIYVKKLNEKKLKEVLDIIKDINLEGL